MTKTIELPNNITITFATNGELVSFAKAKINALKKSLECFEEDLYVASNNFCEYYAMRYIENLEKEINFWSQFLSK